MSPSLGGVENDQRWLPVPGDVPSDHFWSLLTNILKWRNHRGWRSGRGGLRVCSIDLELVFTSEMVYHMTYPSFWKRSKIWWAQLSCKIYREKKFGILTNRTCDTFFRCVFSCLGWWRCSFWFKMHISWFMGERVILGFKSLFNFLRPEPSRKKVYGHAFSNSICDEESECEVRFSIDPTEKKLWAIRELPWRFHQGENASRERLKTRCIR